jgi:hypothetical protein
MLNAKVATTVAHSNVGLAAELAGDEDSYEDDPRLLSPRYLAMKRAYGIGTDAGSDTTLQYDFASGQTAAPTEGPAELSPGLNDSATYQTAPENDLSASNISVSVIATNQSARTDKLPASYISVSDFATNQAAPTEGTTELSPGVNDSAANQTAPENDLTRAIHHVDNQALAERKLTTTEGARLSAVPSYSSAGGVGGCLPDSILDIAIAPVGFFRSSLSNSIEQFNSHDLNAQNFAEDAAVGIANAGLAHIEAAERTHASPFCFSGPRAPMPARLRILRLHLLGLRRPCP